MGAITEFERYLIEERSAAGRTGSRPDIYRSKNIKIMNSLIENGTLIKNVTATTNNKKPS